MRQLHKGYRPPATAEREEVSRGLAPTAKIFCGYYPFLAARDLASSVFLIAVVNPFTKSRLNPMKVLPSIFNSSKLSGKGEFCRKASSFRATRIVLAGYGRKRFTTLP